MPSSRHMPTVKANQTSLGKEANHCNSSRTSWSVASNTSGVLSSSTHSAAQTHNGQELFSLGTARSHCCDTGSHQVPFAQTMVAVTRVLSDAPSRSQRLSENESKHQMDLITAAAHFNCMSTSFSAKSLCTAGGPPQVGQERLLPIFEMQSRADPTSLANQLHKAAS